MNLLIQNKVALLVLAGKSIQICLVISCWFPPSREEVFNSQPRKLHHKCFKMTNKIPIIVPDSLYGIVAMHLSQNRLKSCCAVPDQCFQYIYAIRIFAQCDWFNWRYCENVINHCHDDAHRSAKSSIISLSVIPSLISCMLRIWCSFSILKLFHVLHFHSSLHFSLFFFNQPQIWFGLIVQLYLWETGTVSKPNIK